MSAYRRALEPPGGKFSLITRALEQSALAYARESPRKRVILPFHQHGGDPLHRMLNAVQPGSYIRPHRHLDPPKAEAFIVLRGALAFFLFDDDGRVQHGVRLAAGSDHFGVDLAPGAYHSFIALEADTLIYEVKNGPYEQATDKSFAPWAPEEDSPLAESYMRALLLAWQQGNQP